MVNAAFTIQHSTFNIQRFSPRMLNVEYSIQHSTFNIQHSAFNIQHSTFSIQHSTINIQQSTFNIHHSTFTIQHSFRSRCSLSFRACCRSRRSSSSTDLSRARSRLRAARRRAAEWRPLSSSLCSFSSSSSLPSRREPGGIWPRQGPRMLSLSAAYWLSGRSHPPARCDDLRQDGIDDQPRSTRTEENRWRWTKQIRKEKRTT